jgi:hypothetical protein
VLTPRVMVSALSSVLGYDIPIIELTEAEQRAQWAAEGFPPDVIEFFVMVQRDTPEIGVTVTPTVEQVTGCPARTFAQWAAENAAAFRA